MVLKSVITYFTGGFSFSVPNEFAFTYALVQFRFLFYSFLICYGLVVPYTVVIMVVTVLLADLRFYIDFNEYIDMISSEGEDSDEDTE